jgi:fatty-acid desaturase
MLTAAKAQARGWRSVYGNALALPFWMIHVGAIAGVVALGWSWRGLAWALGLYAVRLFFVTAAYHRYFSHRAYKTSRWFQFVLALGATATAQKGVLWWAAHHRRHHRASDTADDLHSPYHGGFWWSHMGWILARDFEGTDHAAIKDFARYPELRWLDRYWVVPPIATAIVTYLIGGWFGLTWAFAVSQVLCWHGTFTINSLSHLWGGRRYQSGDDSRNKPDPGDRHPRRGLAQQPPPLPGGGAPGLLLVGVRRHLLRAAAPGRARVGPRPPRRAGAHPVGQPQGRHLRRRRPRECRPVGCDRRRPVIPSSMPR